MSSRKMLAASTATSHIPAITVTVTVTTTTTTTTTAAAATAATTTTTTTTIASTYSLTEFCPERTVICLMLETQLCGHAWTDR